MSRFFVMLLLIMVSGNEMSATPLYLEPSSLMVVPTMSYMVVSPTGPAIYIQVREPDLTPLTGTFNDFLDRYCLYWVVFNLMIAGKIAWQ